ncbi:hypothetical protein [Microbulbifer hainanensis]|uniref:hypothetical protein n=1 Tax=Microbulbifer hainanensis TaxID=2735675 RepID=UPI0018694BBE|nr:hypothetical protein [Microbulbifer hainanensis]
MCSIYLIGVATAVAIPAELAEPVSEISGLLALALIDLATLGLPLSAAFLLLAYGSKFLTREPDAVFYTLLLAPLILLRLYFSLLAPGLSIHLLAATLPHLLLLLACYFYLVRSAQRAQA